MAEADLRKKHMGGTARAEKGRAVPEAPRGRDLRGLREAAGPRRGLTGACPQVMQRPARARRKAGARANPRVRCLTHEQVGRLLVVRGATPYCGTAEHAGKTSPKCRDLEGWAAMSVAS